VEKLRFRIARSQLRGLITYQAFVGAVGAVLTIVWIMVGGQIGSTIWPWAVGADLVALIGLYAYLAYAVAFTECTVTGIRTRGLWSEQHCSWAEVKSISPRLYKRTTTVVIATTYGTSFRLGAPVDGGVMRDPEFAPKVMQIREYQRAASPHGGSALR
jgi:hypothetical protein